MPNIIRIRNLQQETNLTSGVTFPVDNDSYTENAKRINILDLKNYILSGVTGATYDMSKYLSITGGTLTGPIIGTELKMDGHENFATADFFTLNSDASGTYGVNAVGYSGANRKIFRTGIYTVQNAFTVDWFDVAGRFAYAFSTGDMIVDGCVSGNTFVKFGGGADQSLQADGTTKILVSGNYSTILTNVSQISDSLVSHSTFSRVGDVIHVMVSGYITPSGNYPILEISLPTSYSMTTGVKVGIGTLWNWTSGITSTGYIETNNSNTVYFHSNITGLPITGMSCDFVTEFDYSLTGGITTTTTTTLAPTTTTTTTLTGTTTTTTTTTLPPVANIQVTNNATGSDQIVAVSVNSFSISGAFFPVLGSAGNTFGTTNQIGGYTIDVSYNIVAGGYRVRFYNNASLVDCQDIISSGSSNVTSTLITINNGDNLQVQLEAVPC